MIGAKWATLGVLCSKMFQAYISGSPLLFFFFILCSMIGDKMFIEITQVSFSKYVLFFSKIGNFGFIVAQNHTSFHLSIHSEDFFQILQPLGHKQNFQKKSSFGSKLISAQLWPKIIEAYITGSTQEVFPNFGAW